MIYRAHIDSNSYRYFPDFPMLSLRQVIAEEEDPAIGKRAAHQPRNCKDLHSSVILGVFIKTLIL